GKYSVPEILGGPRRGRLSQRVSGARRGFIPSFPRSERGNEIAAPPIPRSLSLPPGTLAPPRAAKKRTNRCERCLECYNRRYTNIKWSAADVLGGIAGARFRRPWPCLVLVPAGSPPGCAAPPGEGRGRRSATEFASRLSPWKAESPLTPPN